MRLKIRKEALNNPNLENAKISLNEAKDKFHARRAKPKVSKSTRNAAQTARLEKTGIEPLLSPMEAAVKDVNPKTAESSARLTDGIDLGLLDEDSDLDGWSIE